jgi:pimeloyl-ACP methyl ester carboxylesterase
MSSPLTNLSDTSPPTERNEVGFPPDSTAILRAAEEAVLDWTGIPIAREDVIVAGTRLHYLSCGEGEPLLLLHDRGLAGATFAPILPMIAAERRAITLDLPGWGLSSKPPFTGRTPQDALNVWIKGTLDLLDALGLDQVDLLGHSMGGFTALGLALDHPDRVRRLILVDPAGLGTDLQMDTRLYFALGPEKLHRRLGRYFTRFVLSSSGGKVHHELEEPFFSFYRELLTQADVLPSGAKAFHTWINFLGVRLTFAHRLPELEMPVLMLWGDSDSLVHYEIGLHTIRSMRDGQLVAFTETGHTPFIERPDAFAKILLSWLDGLYVRARI